MLIRFDFNHFTFPTKEELLRETIVNQEIAKIILLTSKRCRYPMQKIRCPSSFGEKYGDLVRVVDMKFSRNYGGTHSHSDIERLHFT